MHSLSAAGTNFSQAVTGSEHRFRCPFHLGVPRSAGTSIRTVPPLRGMRTPLQILSPSEGCVGPGLVGQRQMWAEGSTAWASGVDLGQETACSPTHSPRKP